MGIKRGMFFSIDGLIALIIILSVVLTVFFISQPSENKSELHTDIITVLSSITVEESTNPYLQTLISQGRVTHLNNTLLEQIGEFYVTDPSTARALAESLLSDVQTQENYGVWYESELIYSKNTTPIESAEEIETARQIISGIQQGANLTGFSGRAILTSTAQEEYYYFGGYTGEGNISAIIEYEGNISSAMMELAISNNFQVYINNNFAGSFSASSEFTPSEYSLPISNFTSGNNTVKLIGDNLHISGGFIRISYIGTGSSDAKKYLSGVEGLINVYDGIYFPSNITSIQAKLHLNTNYSAFFNIGNKTVYNGTTNGEETITLSNSQLSSLLDYSYLSGKNVPIRVGISNASYITNGTPIDVDAFSVTDLSGSMCGTCSGGSFFCCLFGGGCSSNQQTCESCSGACTAGIYEAKAANNIFIDSLLNSSGNKVGLVGYKGSAANADYHALSTSVSSLKSKVTAWRASGQTCICCGINKAVSSFGTYNESRARSIVVMSDGEANNDCPNVQGTGDAKQDAINAACTAYDDYNITVYAVGFNENADEETLQAIAACGNGQYYYGDINQITEIYEQIAQEIIEASYSEQTIEASGGLYTVLHPDSYIQISSQQQSPQYGLKTTYESQFYSTYEGSFNIPDNYTLAEARVTSYSGQRWTDKVFLNGNIIYNLTNFGKIYTELGDPFNIELPINLNGNNTVRVTTASSPQNSTEGSQYNKIIYTLARNVTTYSPVSANANGCTWTIEFDSGTNTTVNIPQDYNGSETCSYTHANIQYNLNDAMQVAVYNLLRELDLDNDNQVDIEFGSGDIGIELTEIIGIPYTWSTEVQVRKWR